MKKLLYLLITLSIISCKEAKKETLQEPETSESSVKAYDLKDITLFQGTIKRVDSFPSKYVIPRTVDVWLPEGYSADKKYGVLFMNDGQNLFDANKTWNHQEWLVDETVSRLMENDSIKDIIVVGIFNVGEVRNSDYFPQKAFESLPQHSKDSLIAVAKTEKSSLYEPGFNADNYLKFIVEEVQPYLKANYSISDNFEDVVIAGSSMGGLISWYAVCEYPEFFGNAICMSTHWPGVMPGKVNPLPKAFYNYLTTNLPSPKDHKFYFDYGTKTLDEMYPPFKKPIDSVFTAKGYSEENFRNLKFEGQDHSEASWNQRFDVPLKFVFKK